MVVERVNPKNNASNKLEELSYNKWIDENLKRIYNKRKGRIEYINRKNRHPNRHEMAQLIDELQKLDLADASALTATLRPTGEKACEAGGWLEFLNQKENQSLLSDSSFFDRLNNSGKIQKRNKIIPTMGAIKQAINSLSPIWKFILSIIAMVMASFLAYLLIEWYKTLSYV